LLSGAVGEKPDRRVEKEGGGLIQINRLALLGEFNAASSKQLLAYYKFKGYPLQYNRKTRKPTTGEEAIEKTLLTYPEDPILPRAVDLRHLKKGAGDLKDASLGRDGRFHSDFPLEPDTGRLASRRPNLMNVPQGRDGGVEGQIAHLIRSTIIPDEGKVLIEFDWKAIEAVLTGWFANDPGYIRLSLLDSHGFYTSYLLADDGKIKEPFSADDPDLQTKLDWLKANFSKERAIGKKINLALGYGMGPKLLARILRCSTSEAVRYIQIKDRMAPIVTEWKAKTQLQAHHDRKLMNPFGFIRYFFSVFTKTSRGTWRPAEEANEALAFLPQSTAAAMLRWVIVELGRMENEYDFELLIPIHDAIIVQTSPSNVKRVIAAVKAVMEREWPELRGLSIKVSTKVGNKNWALMTDDD
jgi:DNA polymerase I-like protein with 3'-5' exonuclease and polymerase domains